MKKRTLMKLLIAAAVALCLAAVIFLNIGEPPVYETQNVSFIVEHFSTENETPGTKTDVLPGEASTLKGEEPSEDEIAVDAGFNLADELPPAAFYLEEVKDFQADMEREAAQRQEAPALQEQ